MEATKPSDHFNPKGFFAVNLQATCDAHCRFSYLSVKTPGSTHDATAFTLSEFSKRWRSKEGKTSFWIAADDAYRATENVITPWPGRNLGPFKDSFNFYFSGGNRNVIERAFGLLPNRWGILWWELQVTLGRVPLVLQTCAALHNFLVNESEVFVPAGTGPEAENTNGRRDSPLCELHFQDECAIEKRIGSRREGEKCVRRMEMIQRLERLGVPDIALGFLISSWGTIPYRV